MKTQIRLQVNGFEHDLLIKPHWTLAEAVLACLILAVRAQGKTILTIEGLSQEGKLDSLQDAFVKFGAIQCGYCTPGMIMTSKALLSKNPHPAQEEIKKALSGNLCRCTGYVKIIEAVTNASRAEAGK